MHTLNLRKKHRSDESEFDSNDKHPRFSYATWVAVAVGGGALLGAGVSAYGANKQAKAISSANQSNQDAQAAQNNSAWANYLLTRGVSPNAPVQAGVLPTSGNYSAVNTRLPIWATVALPKTNGVTTWQKKVGPMPSQGTGDAAPASGGSSQRSIANNILDPLNIRGGGKGALRSVADPLNLFCWAAREVYGEDNPKWLTFRAWMLNRAPAWLKEAYMQHGEQMAERIKQSPNLRAKVRSIMDGIMASESLAT